VAVVEGLVVTTTTTVGSSEIDLVLLVTINFIITPAVTRFSFVYLNNSQWANSPTKAVCRSVFL